MLEVDLSLKKKVRVEGARAPLAIHPALASYRDAIVAHRDETRSRHAGERIVIGGVARLATFFAEPVVSLQNGCFALLELEIDRHPFVLCSQAHRSGGGIGQDGAL